MSQLIGITRERVFSPGRVDDDRAIIEMVGERLRDLGHAVSLVDPESSPWPRPSADTVVFTMCQGTEALRQLQQWQERGVRVINSTEGILNCQRHRTVALLGDGRVAFPESQLFDTAVRVTPPSWFAATGAWLKRGDVHATEPDDVMFADGPAALHAALERFRARGIRQAVLQRHVPGTVLKFYAVRGQFFHCVPPSDARAVTADVLRGLHALGDAAARALQVEIYGGDCVCDASGALTLIDLNDWPSYARCRTEAAKAIAAYLDAQAVTTRL